MSYIRRYYDSCSSSFLSDSLLSYNRRILQQCKTITSHYEKNDNKIDQLYKTLNFIHAGTISLKKAVISNFPWTTEEQVYEFAAKNDMGPLRIRLASVPYKSFKAYISDILLSFMSKELVANIFTWPSPQ